MVDGEIISADSVQIYQGLDIGSAKPTAEEQAAVRHHLVDDLPFTAQYNAVEFAMAARAAIEDVVSRGKVPLVVGGNSFLPEIVGRRDPNARSRERGPGNGSQSGRDGVAFRVGGCISSPCEPRPGLR